MDFARSNIDIHVATDRRGILFCTIFITRVYWQFLIKYLCANGLSFAIFLDITSTAVNAIKFTATT